jgi:hypothetical protein
MNAGKRPIEWTRRGALEFARARRRLEWGRARCSGSRRSVGRRGMRLLVLQTHLAAGHGVDAAGITLPLDSCLNSLHR